MPKFFNLFRRKIFFLLCLIFVLSLISVSYFLINSKNNSLKNIFIDESKKISASEKDNIKNTKQQIQAKAITVTPTQIPTPTPTAVPTLVPTATPIPQIPIPTPPITTSNSLPINGFSQQSVSTENGNFTVDIIAGDLNTTRVVVDTASDSTCANDCPVLPLAIYATRSGAYAAINGTFFCPTSYPQCAGKTNSFDTLLMNKNKVYFNSDNNVYSTVPIVVFKENWARFMTRSLEWGRDTSIDSAIAMQPLLVFSGQNVYSGSGDAKYNSKSPRSFVANKGNTAYIGVVFSATMDDAAKVLKALGVDNALNLDDGGSSALWFNGYLVGPGRNIPNALLFVRK